MNNTHPCAGKCSEFKEGGQCFHCLINETVNRGVYSMHRTEHRINHIVDINDMGDDAHIENHISPLCVSKSSENESQGDLSLKENKGAFERFYKAKYMQGMSEIQIKNHHDLFRFNDYANEYWHNIVNRQWHAWNARQPEISAMQIKVDELQKQNSWLSGVAERENKRANNLQQDKTSTTILLGKTIQEKNELTKQRDSFIKAYEIEMDTSLELQKRVDAAKQLVNEMKGKRYPFSAYADQLEQAIKGDEEYIRAQCGMLGGGGEA